LVALASGFFSPNNNLYFPPNNFQFPLLYE
jgi:hypothetical protein